MFLSTFLKLPRQRGTAAKSQDRNRARCRTPQSHLFRSHIGGGPLQLL